MGLVAEWEALSTITPLLPIFAEILSLCMRLNGNLLNKDSNLKEAPHIGADRPESTPRSPAFFMLGEAAPPLIGSVTIESIVRPMTHWTADTSIEHCCRPTQSGAAGQRIALARQLRACTSAGFDNAHR